MNSGDARCVQWILCNARLLLATLAGSSELKKKSYKRQISRASYSFQCLCSWGRVCFFCLIGELETKLQSPRENSWTKQLSDKAAPIWLYLLKEKEYMRSSGPFPTVFSRFMTPSLALARDEALLRPIALKVRNFYTTLATTVFWGALTVAGPWQGIIVMALRLPNSPNATHETS